jgi:predicted secreted Zn-dependent protease
MKSLKRNLLALAIIGAPFAAQAELKPIDDAQMGSITGQAGVTIEL